MLGTEIHKWANFFRLILWMTKQNVSVHFLPFLFVVVGIFFFLIKLSFVNTKKARLYGYVNIMYDEMNGHKNKRVNFCKQSMQYLLRNNKKKNIFFTLVEAHNIL